jgi:hypothetical protein
MVINSHFWDKKSSFPLLRDSRHLLVDFLVSQFLVLYCSTLSHSTETLYCLSKMASNDENVTKKLKQLYTYLAHPWFDMSYVLFLVLCETILCTVIIRFVPYTEIDWEAYMQEVWFPLIVVLLLLYNVCVCVFFVCFDSLLPHDVLTSRAVYHYHTHYCRWTCMNRVNSIIETYEVAQVHLSIPLAFYMYIAFSRVPPTMDKMSFKHKCILVLYTFGILPLCS